MAKKNNKQFQKGQIGKFVAAICEEYKLEQKEVAQFMLRTFPELKDKEKCANCSANMSIYEHRIDTLDALLLVGMGKIVGEKVKAGMTFKEANRVHVQSELNRYYSVASRTTWCSKLGLITKVKHKDGVHDQKAGWLITKRGFAFLAGKPVPCKVQTFRNGITERFEDETVSIWQVQIKEHSMEGRELLSHKDYPFETLENYSIVGFSQGQLL